MLKKLSTCEVTEVIPGRIKKASKDDNPFEIPNKDGMLYVRVRAIASKINNNYDAFEREELRKAYKTFIGKPVFIEHQNKNPEHARGIVIDAAFHDDQPYAWIELLLEIDAEAYPLLAEGLRKGRINKVSMGTNVEYSVCSVCGNVARSEKEYCYHIRNKGRIFKNAKGEDVLAYEINRGLNFFEISFVVSPAEEWADVLAVYGEQDRNKLQKVASKIRRPGESIKCWNNRVGGLRKIAKIVKGGDEMRFYHTDEVIPIKKRAQTKKNYVAYPQSKLARKKMAYKMLRIATQGVFIEGRRPKTKAELQQALKENPESVVLDAISAFGYNYYGPITKAPDGDYFIVGPAPNKGYKWHAKITKKGDIIKISTRKMRNIEKESAINLEWTEEVRRGRGGGTHLFATYRAGRRTYEIHISPYSYRGMEGYKYTISYIDPTTGKKVAYKVGVTKTINRAKDMVQRALERVRAGRRPMPGEAPVEKVEETIASMKRARISKISEEFSAPMKPDTIISPEGEEISRQDLEPVEKKEKKTLEAFLERLQALIDEFMGEKAEEEIEEANEESNLENALPEEENEEKENKEEEVKETSASYTNLLLAKRLVYELKKRGAISEEEELEKEAEYAQLSKEELEEKIRFISSIPPEEEKAVEKTAKKRPPVLRKSLAMNRPPIETDILEVNPMQLFL
jgi:hypothetical protein